MSDVFEVVPEGFDEALAKLGAEKMIQACQASLQRFGEEVKLRALVYPAEGPWCMPGSYPARWYQRGFGPRWARKDGSTGGRDTSERMQQQWAVEQRSPLETLVGNRASYAPYVQGDEQTGFHAAHGWKKLLDVAVENKDLFYSIFEREFKKAIGG
jgi:hypothetical protein